MVAIGMKVLKKKLSDYTRAAVGGETILITDGDESLQNFHHHDLTAVLSCQMLFLRKQRGRVGLHHPSVPEEVCPILNRLLSSAGCLRS